MDPPPLDANASLEVLYAFHGVSSSHTQILDTWLACPFASFLLPTLWKVVCVYFHSCLSDRVLQQGLLHERSATSMHLAYMLAVAKADTHTKDERERRSNGCDWHKLREWEQKCWETDG